MLSLFGSGDDDGDNDAQKFRMDDPDTYSDSRYINRGRIIMQFDAQPPDEDDEEWWFRQGALLREKWLDGEVGTDYDYGAMPDPLESLARPTRRQRTATDRRMPGVEYIRIGDGYRPLFKQSPSPAQTEEHPGRLSIVEAITKWHLRTRFADEMWIDLAPIDLAPLRLNVDEEDFGRLLRAYNDDSEAYDRYDRAEVYAKDEWDRRMASSAKRRLREKPHPEAEFILAYLSR